jgi:hypothetical protein
MKKSTELYTEEVIRETLIEHYFPLVDCKLKEEYRTIYKNGIKIFLNGKEKYF